MANVKLLTQFTPTTGSPFTKDSKLFFIPCMLLTEENKETFLWLPQLRINFQKRFRFFKITLTIKIRAFSWKGQEVWFSIERIKSRMQSFLKEPTKNYCQNFVLIWGTRSARLGRVNIAKRGSKRAQFITQMCSWEFPNTLLWYLWSWSIVYSNAKKWRKRLNRSLKKRSFSWQVSKYSILLETHWLSSTKKESTFWSWVQSLSQVSHPNRFAKFKNQSESFIRIWWPSKKMVEAVHVVCLLKSSDFTLFFS